MTRRRKSDAETKPTIEELADGLQAVMREAGVSEGTATVYRKAAVGGEEEYLDRIGVDDVGTDILEQLKGRWGGGRYRIVLKDQDGQYVKGGSLHFNVAGPPRDLSAPDRFDELEAKWTERIEKAQATGTGSSEIVLLLFQQMQEQLREIRNAPAQAQQANPVELAISLAASMQAANGPLLEALLERKSNQPDPMEMVTQVLGMAVQLKELGGDGGSGMDKVIGQLATPLGRFFDSQADAAQRSVAAAPVPTPSAQNGQTPMPDPANAPAWYPLLKRAIPQLVQWSKEGKDPELRADLILEELPDRFLAPIHEQLRRGDAFTAEFLAQVPEAQDTREWFGLFFGRILESLEAMWTPEEEEAAKSAEPPAELPAATPAAELEEELEEELELEEAAPGAGAPPTGDAAPDVDGGAVN